MIVKIDDVGLYLTQQANAAKQAVGHFLLRFVPKLLTFLSIVGTIAMLWVGGGIIVHGTHEVGFHAIYDSCPRRGICGGGDDRRGSAWSAACWAG